MSTSRLFSFSVVSCPHPYRRKMNTILLRVVVIKILVNFFFVILAIICQKRKVRIYDLLLNSLPSHLCAYMGWQLAGKISCRFFWSLVLFSTGSRFCYLGLTALPVDYKAHRSNQNTPSSIPPERVSSASTTTVLEQRHWWNDTHWWKEYVSDFQVLFPGERNSRHSSFSICSPIALRNVPPGSTSSAEPLFLNSFGFIYMYFHISFLYVPAALVWQQMTEGYRFYHGHQVRCHHAEQSQFPWAAYDMHCWSNVIPRVCHHSDINIFFS